MGFYVLIVMAILIAGQQMLTHVIAYIVNRSGHMHCWRKQFLFCINSRCRSSIIISHF